MPRMVQCIKLKREAEGLEKPPLKGPMGQKIFENISKQAWQEWLEHSQKLIKEDRPAPLSPTRPKIWFTAAGKYFWGDGSKLPDEFKPVAEEGKG